eukprot:CAMPEP_0172471034 /NCGR_PEP_ID=MMETSP1065-20121228/67609_1 /TAXON_ID=265537 /ORGANISM="Amphiprora paludosa, Strain CCMP125" /LENGTH=578 /DNA_ID=CAMNT_0013229117 /DNA_START=168 /DNA_END=1904 /DNA_ORIENTATION=-
MLDLRDYYSDDGLGDSPNAATRIMMNRAKLGNTANTTLGDALSTRSSHSERRQPRTCFAPTASLTPEQAQIPTFDMSQLKLGRRLGSGAFCSVYCVSQVKPSSTTPKNALNNNDSSLNNSSGSLDVTGLMEADVSTAYSTDNSESEFAVAIAGHLSNGDLSIDEDSTAEFTLPPTTRATPRPRLTRKRSGMATAAAADIGTTSPTTTTTATSPTPASVAPTSPLANNSSSNNNNTTTTMSPPQRAAPRDRRRALRTYRSSSMSMLQQPNPSSLLLQQQQQQQPLPEQKQPKDNALACFQRERLQALKCLRKKTKRSPKETMLAYQDLQNEVLVLSQLPSHPHIVRFWGIDTQFWTVPETACFMQEKLVQTLDQALDTWQQEAAASKSGLSLMGKRHLRASAQAQRLETLLLPLARALEFLHSHNVLYRDLKPSNVGLDKQGQVRLFDFGLAIRLPKDKKKKPKKLPGKVGTYRYMAPEVARSEHYGYPADVYSFGMVLWEVLCYEKPYQKATSLDQLCLVVQQGTSQPALTNIAAKSMKQLLQEGLWNPQPKLRPDFATVIQTLQQEVEYRAMNKSGH